LREVRCSREDGAFLASAADAALAAYDFDGALCALNSYLRATAPVRPSNSDAGASIVDLSSLCHLTERLPVLVDSALSACLGGAGELVILVCEYFGRHLAEPVRAACLWRTRSERQAIRAAEEDGCLEPSASGCAGEHDDQAWFAPDDWGEENRPPGKRLRVEFEHALQQAAGWYRV